MPNSAPNPYKQGVCKICGVEKKVFTKSEICQSCNMNKPKPKDAPPTAKPDLPTSRGEIITQIDEPCKPGCYAPLVEAAIAKAEGKE